MTLSTVGKCVDQTYRGRIVKRRKTIEEKNVHVPGEEREVLGTSKSTRVQVVIEHDKSHMDASGDSSAIQPLDIVKALVMASDFDIPELNRVEFARTPSDDEDAEAYEPIFDESELPPRPVKHKKKKSKDGKTLKQSSSDNEKAKAERNKTIIIIEGHQQSMI